jgi:thiamine kinase-like enzyme
VDEWRGKTIETQKIGGLTNENYLVSVDNERFVLRISRRNTQDFGNNRVTEYESLKIASNAGIAPKVYRYFLPEGHMVTRYIDGRHWTGAEYFDDENRSRLIEMVKKIHALPAIKTTFSPFERTSRFSKSAKRLNADFPNDYDAFLSYQERIKKSQNEDKSDWMRLCHNDLYFVNFIDDGRLWILDWEFAGMGDIYYDLAILVYAYESFGVLPVDKRERILRDYFGEVKPFHWLRLNGMCFMLLYFNALWALVQEGNVRAGNIPSVEGFDYQEYADDSFSQMRQMIREDVNAF